MDVRYLSDYFLQNICPIPPKNERRYDIGEGTPPKIGPRPYLIICLSDYIDEIDNELFAAVPICHYTNEKTVDYGTYGNLGFDHKKNKNACLDYKKIMIIADEHKYLGTLGHKLSTSEYNHIKTYYSKITSEVVSFIKNYIKSYRDGKYVHHCTLGYFHKELNL